MDEFTLHRWGDLAQQYVDAYEQSGKAAAVEQVTKNLQAVQYKTFFNFLREWCADNGYQLEAA